MIHTKENRPGGQTEAMKSSNVVGAGSGSIVAQMTLADEDLDRAHALVVLVEDRTGRYRRRLYLSLRSAERAVARANARGADARAILCRITPVEDGEAQ